MHDRNESTHDRLNRELSRLTYHNMSYWGGWALLVGIVGLGAVIALNTPQNIRYVQGVAGATMSVPTEARIVIITRVQVDGRSYDLRLPSQLVHPGVGDTLCLRAAERRFSGHTSYVNVSERFCADVPPNGAQATPDVE